MDLVFDPKISLYFEILLQIVQINESPLFVKMNPLARKTDVSI